MNQDVEKRLLEIRDLVRPFCTQHLDDELTGFVEALCDMVGHEQMMTITRGKPEIWAAAIVYVIARLNFLFDKANPLFLTADTICDYFGTIKSTTGQKATLIEEACDITRSDSRFCQEHIRNIFKFYITEDGFLVSASMVEGVPQKEDAALTCEEREALRLEREREEALKQKEREKRIRREREEKRRAQFKDQQDLFGDPLMD